MAQAATLAGSRVVATALERTATGAAAGTGPRLSLIVHHDDSTREWAYDRESHIGKLERELDEGPQRGWIIVSIKNDWKRVYPTR